MKNMGFDYVKFRAGYELKRKTGFLKSKFPTETDFKQFISLNEWKALEIPFFFQSKEDLDIRKEKNKELQETYNQFQNGKIKYFNSKYLDIGTNYNWTSNPTNNYQYNISKHWTEVEDLSSEAGDIKYVWEKSRFSFLLSLLRYDYHFEQDCAQQVFDEIDSWIDKNPINQGPNYKCSQEISIRLMNWAFALHYYKNSDKLTEALFQKIINSIYWQLHHVRSNINFSRKAVRNNHAISETLMLCISGWLFPFIDESEKWQSEGKKWFEEEILYQIYEDGTFLQYAHNYHRVVIQLLVYALSLSELNGERFEERVYEKAIKSLNYLFQCQEEGSGRLPHYGNNDGALFFKFSNAHFRDYRPQLNALYYFFNRKHLFDDVLVQENAEWFCSKLSKKENRNIVLKKDTLSTFEDSGCYLIRSNSAFLFIKCGNHKHRPTHADNLHLDLWYKGINYLRDAGTYKYNTKKELVNYFNGTQSHNTIQLGNYDQMKKGPRFIWLRWSSCESANIEELEDAYQFEGSVNVYKHVEKEIKHKRTIKQFKNNLHWEVVDTVRHNTNLPIKQIWNIHPNFNNVFEISAKDENGVKIKAMNQKGYYSDLYGTIEETSAIVFKTNLKKITTVINLK